MGHIIGNLSRVVLARDRKVAFLHSPHGLKYHRHRVSKISLCVLNVPPLTSDRQIQCTIMQCLTIQELKIKCITQAF